jgi:hypothetical protein
MSAGTASSTSGIWSRMSRRRSVRCPRRSLACRPGKRSRRASRTCARGSPPGCRTTPGAPEGRRWRRPGRGSACRPCRCAAVEFVVPGGPPAVCLPHRNVLRQPERGAAQRRRGRSGPAGNRDGDTGSRCRHPPGSPARGQCRSPPAPPDQGAVPERHGQVDSQDPAPDQVNRERAGDRRVAGGRHQVSEPQGAAGSAKSAKAGA